LNLHFNDIRNRNSLSVHHLIFRLTPPFQPFMTFNMPLTDINFCCLHGGFIFAASFNSKILKKMKKLILSLIVAAMSVSTFAQSYEYKIITVIESIVPMGLGRSRIIENKQEVNASDLTTPRTDGRTSRQREVSRSDAKINEFEETTLLNFYSGVGINFQNIASNDAIITAKIMEIVEDGWELAFALSGVESDCGEGDGKGIYITRFIFKRKL